MKTRALQHLELRLHIAGKDKARKNSAKNVRKDDAETEAPGDDEQSGVKKGVWISTLPDVGFFLGNSLTLATAEV